MEQNQNKSNNQPRPEDKRPKGGLGLTLIITVAIVLLLSSLFNMVKGSQYTQTTFTEFQDARQAGQLAEVLIQYDRILYMTKDEAAKPASQQKACYTGLPSGDVLALAEALEAEGVVVDYKITEDNSFIMMILSYVIMFAIVFFGMRMLTKRMGDGGIMGGMGASKAKVYMEKQTG